MLIDLNIFYVSLITVVILIAVGFLLGKIGWVDEHFNKKLVNILLLVAMPCALFGAFPSAFEPKMLELFLWGLGGGAALFVAFIVVSRLLFNKRRDKKLANEYQFTFIFNNAIFLGYPIISTVFGEQGLMPYAGFVLVFNLMLFSYGILLFLGKFSLRKAARVFINPNIIAIILGLLVFVFSLSLPEFAHESIGYIGGIMTPLSLVCIGFMLSVARLGQALKNRKLILVCIAQLVLGPIIAFIITKLINAPVLVTQIIVLISALPTATTLGLFAEKYNNNTQDASSLVALSTIMSAATVPIVILLLSYVQQWGIW